MLPVSETTHRPTKSCVWNKRSSTLALTQTRYAALQHLLTHQMGFVAWFLNLLTSCASTPGQLTRRKALLLRLGQMMLYLPGLSRFKGPCQKTLLGCILAFSHCHHKVPFIRCCPCHVAWGKLSYVHREQTTRYIGSIMCNYIAISFWVSQSLSLVVWEKPNWFRARIHLTQKAVSNVALRDTYGRVISRQARRIPAPNI